MENKSYKDTLNLPRSDFPMRANLAELEPQIQINWEKMNLYSKIKEHRRTAPRYTLHDGPPYANGNIHLGHALNKILKDIIIKYKTMSGYFTMFVPGWDCHGLPIELAVLEKKQLHLSEDIDKNMVRRYCRDYALHYANIQAVEFRRLGVFGDWERPYMTLDKEYVLSVIDIFYRLLSAGYVYRSLKPVYWCMNCMTAEAEAEVEYENISAPSIYVKFQIVKNKKFFEYYDRVSFLVWTTTPWTLPANLAVCLHPDFDYSLCRVQINSRQEYIILLHELIKDIEDMINLEFRVIKTYKGKELEGIVCKHPFLDREVKTVVDKYVRARQGSGCVHIAPGHGLEDYQIGLRYNLEVLSPIDKHGRFLEEASRELQGLRVDEAEDKIIQLIKDKDNLLYKTEIIHSYPHCWRCKKPIIYRATKQWFFDLNKNNLKEKILSFIDNLTWIPQYAKERFYNTLKQREDWCISRQRAWGVPITVIYCTNCENVVLDEKIVSKIKELIAKFDKDIWFNLKVEDLLEDKYKCRICEGEDFKKEEDILDVWLESGASFHAVLKKRDEVDYPADVYLEGSDQHRGWFQSAMILAFAIDNIAPYKSVLTHGFILDERGMAMHKSIGNVVSPQDIIRRYGADILRLWVASEDYTTDVKFGENIILRCVDIYRKLRNTIRFMLSNLYDFDPNTTLAYDDLLPQDKWILHKFQELIKKVEKSYESFEFHRVVSFINNFCTNYLSSFYLDILKDRLYILKFSDKRRRCAQFALHYILTELLKLIAPILSHTAEEAYKYIKKEDRISPESIHLNDFPKVREEYINPQIDKEFSILLAMREKVYFELEKLRREKKIGSSLEAHVKIFTKHQVFDKYNEYLPEIFIVSQIDVYKVEGGEERVEVVVADGIKCQRCWMWLKTVDEDSLLCPRCREILSSTRIN